MRYLGRVSGHGLVMCDGKSVARAAYDFDGYLRPKTGVMSCGEIRLDASALKDVFGRLDVQLQTDDGRLFDIRFSEKKLESSADSAHVDVTGELPGQQDWRH
ncbi:MAG: hypothetical protein ACLP8A_14970 [Methylovirgula sp.]